MPRTLNHTRRIDKSIKKCHIYLLLPSISRFIFSKASPSCWWRPRWFGPGTTKLYTTLSCKHRASILPINIYAIVTAVRGGSDKSISGPLLSVWLMTSVVNWIKAWTDLMIVNGFLLRQGLF
ncbi:unnamed protein product [Vicia faba]|uniref:Uncharacterized protein n=1 Tax=Vicia faba TaxID=3906 RepID=A0AAV1AD06_VICFA|nr:unnamed protein product [Vicia faba]